MAYIGAMPATVAAIAPRPPLDIIIAAPRGFCAGVDRAIRIVELAIERLIGVVRPTHKATRPIGSVRAASGDTQ